MIYKCDVFNAFYNSLEAIQSGIPLVFTGPIQVIKDDIKTIDIQYDKGSYSEDVLAVCRFPSGRAVQSLSSFI